MNTIEPCESGWGVSSLEEENSEKSSAGKIHDVVESSSSDDYEDDYLGGAE